MIIDYLYIRLCPIINSVTNGWQRRPMKVMVRERGKGWAEASGNIDDMYISLLCNTMGLPWCCVLIFLVEIGTDR